MFARRRLTGCAVPVRRQLLQTSEGQEGTSGEATSGVSSESSVTGSGLLDVVTESYRGWGGEDPAGGGIVGALSTIGSLIGSFLLIGLVIAVVAGLVVAGVLAFKKHKASRKSSPAAAGSNYVLMEDGLNLA